MNLLCIFITGVPEEHCKKLLGAHFETKLCLTKKKAFWSTTCCECPEYNFCGAMPEGVEQTIPCMPGFGGKVWYTKQIYTAI